MCRSSIWTCWGSPRRGARARCRGPRSPPRGRCTRRPGGASALAGVPDDAGRVVGAWVVPVHRDAVVRHIHPQTRLERLGHVAMAALHGQRAVDEAEIAGSGRCVPRTAEDVERAANLLATDTYPGLTRREREELERLAPEAP